jgi:NhaC family Na+:H+ antiporter
MSEASNATEEIQSNSKIRLSIWQALVPIIALVGMLAYNVFIYGEDSLGGSNQFILLMGGAVAAIVGVVKGVKFEVMIEDVAKNIKATVEPILILLLVGALAGTWLLSGIIPTMIYYGLQILNPTIFLAATVVICSVISIATGSSWTTSATVGIALIGIAEALGVSVAMTAGAVLSGGYFGDKLSPMSDTTNLAPAMAGTDLFTHIRYMTLTTVPTIIVTLIAFIIIGLNLDTSGQTNPEEILDSIDASFNITPWLFVVPVVVIALIIKKTPPLIALLLGTLLAAGAALIFQPGLVQMIGGGDTLNFETAYRGIIDAITVEITIPSENKSLQGLFSAGGMAGMLGTIWLIICAMVFGGIMDAIGALERISEALLNLFTSIFGLFFSTVSSCIVLNLTASDQYLAIVVPGKMFEKAYEKKGLAPENLSRTLEDSGTVTSVLIPWNTCGAYHSGVLGVPVADYFFYAIFNYLSPFVTLIFAAFNIKIKQLTKSKL